MMIDPEDLRAPRAGRTDSVDGGEGAVPSISCEGSVGGGGAAADAEVEAGLVVICVIYGGGSKLLLGERGVHTTPQLREGVDCPGRRRCLSAAFR